jgi:predicted Zn-dependent protease
MLAFLGMAHFAGGRFEEAIPPLREAGQLRPEWPLPQANLAATYGAMENAAPAREALARFRALTDVDIGAWASTLGPGLQKLIVEGVALAEAESPEAHPEH